MLDKCTSLLGHEGSEVFLGHCAISRLYQGAAEAIREYSESMVAGGVAALPEYFDIMPRFHKHAASLLKTVPENISFVQNTATALNMIAGGYPFQPGDQVISYQHEYPSNHYPWAMQQGRGVELLLLSDYAEQTTTGHDLIGWSMSELEQMVTPRTRVLAISHVQFASGHAADLQALGSFCLEHGIDLIVDCAQSLGCLPVYPEEYNIAAMASSGWKWLMGPFGAGVMYTSAEMRDKLTLTMAGPGSMQQSLDYLDLSWNPHPDGRVFEYSALPWDHVAALDAVISQIFLKNSMEDIRTEIFRLQDVFLTHLDPVAATPLILPEKHRSGIIPLKVAGDAQFIIQALHKHGVVITGPTGCLRLAPHFYMSDEQLQHAARVFNSVALGKIHPDKKMLRKEG